MRAIALVIMLAVVAAWLAFGPFNREARLRRMDVPALKRAARAHPDDPELFLQLWRRLRQRGELHPAAVMSSRAYDLSDGAPRFVAAKVSALIDSGEFESAYRLAKDTLGRGPDSGEVRAQLSRLYAGRGYFTDALREAEVAVRRAPGQSEAWQALGNADASNKRPDAAFAAFERAMALEPRDAELLADYGEALARFGRAAEAEGVLRRAMNLAPGSARPPGLLGRLLAERASTPEQQTEARTLLERALARAPRATDPMYALATLELRDGQEKEAIRLLNTCLALDPTYGEAYLALGQAYQRQGDAGRAGRAFAAWQRFSDYRRQAAHLEMRLRRRPGDPDLRRRLERLKSAYAQPVRSPDHQQSTPRPSDTGSIDPHPGSGAVSTLPTGGTRPPDAE
jgi:tetratricopeptide (TPR) repeat protein